MAPGTRAVLGDRRLLRLSLAGLLLVVPQFLGSVFLVEVLHDGGGIPLALAGGLLALTQVLGALGRLGNGVWSDRAASRLGPLRVIAVTIAVGFALSALVEPGPAALLAAVLVPAAALAISWNGLVFTAAGELAPPGRAATAMALSNTANYVAAAATPPALGGLVAEAGGLAGDARAGRRGGAGRGPRCAAWLNPAAHLGSSHTTRRREPQVRARGGGYGERGPPACDVTRRCHVARRAVRKVRWSPGH